MNDEEFLDFLQTQRDFEDEGKQRFKQVLDNLVKVCHLTPEEVSEWLQKIAKSDNATQSEAARDFLVYLSKSEESK
jgi:hypothetical protein